MLVISVIIFIFSIFLICIAIATWLHTRAIRFDVEDMSYIEMAQALSTFQTEFKTTGKLLNASKFALDQIEISAKEMLAKNEHIQEAVIATQHLLVEIKTLKEKAQ